MDTNGIPQNVIEALAAVRDNGAYNMFDRRNVTDFVSMIDEDAGEWLQENKNRYMDALNAMGEYISKPKTSAPVEPPTMDKPVEPIHEETTTPATDASGGTESAQAAFAVGDGLAICEYCGAHVPEEEIIDGLCRRCRRNGIEPSMSNYGRWVAPVSVEPATAQTVTEGGVAEISIIGDNTDLIYNALDELYVIGGKRHEDMAQNAKRAWLDYYDELEAARAEIVRLKVEKAHEHEHLETNRVMREIAIAEALGLHRDTFLSVDTDEITDAIAATREQLAACVAALAVALERFSMIKQGVTYKSWEYKQADKAIVEIEALNASANPRTEGV